MQTFGAVTGLWRYPVKSMLGEGVEELEIDDQGCAGDRAWALVDADGMLASGKDSRRFRRAEGMMRHGARLAGDEVEIEFADGVTARSDGTDLASAIRSAVGPGWTLTHDRGTAHVDAAPVHLITETSLRTLSDEAGVDVAPERVRPNILIAVDEAAGFPEDGWVGRRLTIGDVAVQVTERTERCVMTSQAQRELPRRPEILKTIGAVNDVCAGIYCEVGRAGTVRVGDAVALNPAPATVRP